MTTEATSTQPTRSEALSTFVLWVLTLLVAAIGLLTLLGWALEVPALTNWEFGTLPMAPSTAALSVLFSIDLGLFITMLSGRIIQVIARILGWVGAMVALLLYVLNFKEAYLLGELLGLPIIGLFSNEAIVHISSITAFCFLLAFVSLLFLRANKPDILWRRWLACCLGGLIFLISFGLLVIYFVGLPLIVSNLPIIPALNTSVMLLLIGLALLTLSYRNFLQQSVQAVIMFSKLPTYLFIFVIFSTGIIAGAYQNYLSIELIFRHQTEEKLLAISRLKVDQLVLWRKERLVNAILSQNILMTARIERLLVNPDTVLSQPEMQDWLNQYISYFKEFGYTHAFFLNKKGDIKISVPEQVNALDPIVKAKALTSMQTGKILIQDFYRTQDGQQIYLALLIPLLDKTDNNKPLGAIVIRIDPSTFLYPLIESSPTPSTSAETLLVRREGDEVLFLNNLRFNTTAALTLHFPLSKKELPAVKAVLGEQGIVDGINYRGAPVLSALKAIPDSPWFIVTQQDKSEIYAPLQERFWLTLLLLCLLELSCGAIILFFWRQQRLVFFQKQFELTSMLREKEEQYRTILNDAIDGFLLMDKEMQLLEVNEAYCRMSAYNEQELKTMQISDLQTPETAKAIENNLAQDINRFESQHRRKDGSIFDVEISAQRLPYAGGQFTAFFQDITEHKQSEKTLKIAASVFTHAREGIMITNNKGTIIQVNDALTEICGYSRDEILGKNPRLFSSGRQTQDFYAGMWHDLNKKGHWYGEIWNRHKNGQIYVVKENISSVFDVQGKPLHYVALLSDITLAKEHENELEHSAYFDALTNLPNRMLLGDRLNQAIVQCKRKKQLLALVFLDLDGFKIINDTHGHLAGDQLLIAVANNMQQMLREGDTLARIGGDEFIALLVDVGDIADCTPLFNRLLVAAAMPEPFNDVTLQVSASMGITFYPQMEEVNADILIRQADQAMYQAKLTGKNRCHIFDVDLDNLTRTHNESLENIGNALAAGEFVLYYQPKINLRQGKIIGAEALIRWQHPDKGLLVPADFLPLIENHPLSIDIGKWVINTALAQIECWHASGLNLPISINIGARQLQQDGFLECLRTLLAAHPAVKPGDLEMEVLETSAMRDLNKVSELIENCQKIGIYFSLDDFGTGYSSLTYLKRLPVKQIKIDQSFIYDMLQDTDDLAIVEGVLALASAFSLEVIAEGMETTQHGEMLLQIGCDLAQGYAIAYPMPAAELESWVSTWKPDTSWLDRLSFMRDDLPLLFVNAEHGVWINGIENYLNSNFDTPRPNNLNCRFGNWLNTQNPSQNPNKQTNLQTILPLHQQLHKLAAEVIDLHAEVIDLHAEDHTKAAFARFGELKSLQDTLLETLKLLIQEKWK
ncbi:EAL domain-containing protein [Methylobacter psychrophilus]|uniref:EAL domain-containing protein n=1 Tax=Methylobacter psychrophilus TaxID=96941 RepID=UPI0021D4D98E|nr:EAL domain-containing protein [Methylobacter psychrophilus]